MKKVHTIVRLFLGCAILVISTTSVLHDISHPFEDITHSAHKHHANPHCLHISSEKECYFCASGPSVTTIGTEFDFISTAPLGYHIAIESGEDLHSPEHSLPSLRAPPISA